MATTYAAALEMYENAQTVKVDLEGEAGVTLTTAKGVLRLDCFEAMELAKQLQDRLLELAERFGGDLGSGAVARA